MAEKEETVGGDAPEEPATEEAPAEPEAVAEKPVPEEAPAEEPVAEAVAEDVTEPEPPAPEPAPRKAKAKAKSAEAKPKASAKATPKPKPAKKPSRKKPAERKPIARLEKPEHERGRRKERQGTVVSSAMDKTIVVRVDTAAPHPRYRKVVRRSTKFHAHDEGNAAKPGDFVRIVETRPLSATKRWRLAEILEEAR